LNNIQSQHIAPTSTTEAAGVIKSLMVEVAEKIIATNEALNAKQEVRITLQDGILKDTDVSISKDGKSINIVFATGSEDSVNLLKNQSGELIQRLQNNLKDIDHVAVDIEHQAADNQNRDGRSKNRSSYEQQTEEDDDEK
jgi:type III secretion system needle length determinant